MAFDLAVWSNSALSLLQECGEAFRRRYIERESEPSSLAAATGTVIHRVAHSSLHRKWKQGVLPTVDETRDLAATQFDATMKQGIRYDEDDIADGVDKARGKAKDFAVALSGYHVRIVAPGITPIGVERTIVVKPQDSDITIKGRLDLIDQRPTGEWVRDLKSSRKSPHPQQADTSQQLTMYAMLRWAEVGQIPERVALDYVVRSQATDRYVPLLSTRSPDDLQTLTNRINTGVEAVKRGSFIPANEDSWKCSPKFCGFHPTCPYVMKGKARTRS